MQQQVFPGLFSQSTSNRAKQKLFLYFACLYSNFFRGRFVANSINPNKASICFTARI